MPSTDPERSVPPPATVPRPRCVACLDIIGVYEPLVHVLGNLAWRTSVAAEPGVATAGGERYHADCYERIARDGQGAPD